MKVRQILLAFRPKTLTAALVPCVAGTAFVYSQNKQVNWNLFVFALLSAFCIQIATNLLNDAEDFKKGADTEKRIGPQRITQSGVLSYAQVMWLGFFVLGLAVAFGVPLVISGGWQILLVGLVSAFLAYGYTAGPFPLAYLGLGDLFVILFFGVIATEGMVFLHQSIWSVPALMLGVQIGLHAAVLIGVNNLRDAATDALVNKKTLAVRLGVSKYRQVVLAMVWIPFLLNGYWLLMGQWGSGLSLLTIPLAIKMTLNLQRTPPGPEYNRFLGQSAGLHLLFGLCLSLGFILSKVS